MRLDSQAVTWLLHQNCSSFLFSSLGSAQFLNVQHDVCFASQSHSSPISADSVIVFQGNNTRKLKPIFFSFYIFAAESFK